MFCRASGIGVILSLWNGTDQRIILRHSLAGLNAMTRPLHGQTYVWLHVFSCAARHLSFTRCAEELHITPGAVSQQIRQLEERLGFRLFQIGRAHV